MQSFRVTVSTPDGSVVVLLVNSPDGDKEKIDKIIRDSLARTGKLVCWIDIEDGNGLR